MAAEENTTGGEIVAKVEPVVKPIPKRPTMYALATLGRDGEWTLSYAGSPRNWIVNSQQPLHPGSQLVVVPALEAERAKDTPEAETTALPREVAEVVQAPPAYGRWDIRTPTRFWDPHMNQWFKRSAYADLHWAFPTSAAANAQLPAAQAALDAEVKAAPEPARGGEGPYRLIEIGTEIWIAGPTNAGVRVDGLSGAQAATLAKGFVDALNLASAAAEKRGRYQVESEIADIEDTCATLRAHVRSGKDQLAAAQADAARCRERCWRDERRAKNFEAAYNDKCVQLANETLRTSEQAVLLRRAAQQIVAASHCDPKMPQRECCRVVRDIELLLAKPINAQDASRQMAEAGEIPMSKGEIEGMVKAALHPGDSQPKPRADGARVEQMPGGLWDVRTDTHFLGVDTRWYEYNAWSRARGYFDTKAEADAALANAPPAPGGTR